MARAVPRPAGRDRMIAAAAGLFGARGVEGTSFSDIVAESRAPRGSIYYYFPEGKRGLVATAVRWTAEVVLNHQRSCGARTPGGILDHFVKFFRGSLARSECRVGCPLAAVAIGSFSPAEIMQGSVRQSFRSWTNLLASQLRGAGVAPRDARSLAVTTLASVEGALILARAAGSVRPLDEVGRQLRALAAAHRRNRPRNSRRGSKTTVRSARI